MSRICSICARGPKTAISRSHSHVATRYRQYPNLQSKKIDGKTQVVCTKCLKTMAKVKK